MFGNNIIPLSVLFVLSLINPGYGQAQSVQRITSILVEPYLMKQENFSLYERNDNDKYYGFAKDLADLLQKELNFTYTLEHVKDNRHGHLDKDGSWNGMIRELVDRSKDMAIAPITITRERIDAVDFTTPFLEFQFGVLMKKPNLDEEGNPIAKDDESDFYVFLRPMTGMLWLAFILVTIFLILFLYLIEFIVVKKIDQTKRQNSTSQQSKPAPSCINGICGTPRSTAGRFLQVVFWIYVIVFVAAYIAAFSANRIVDRMGMDKDEQEYIESLDDFIKETDIVYGTVRAGSTYEFFQHSTNPLYAKMYQMMLKRKDKEPKSFKATLEKGIEGVRKGNGTYAFIMESPSAQFAASKKPCDLYVLPELFGPKRGFGVATTKGHSLKDKLNIAILTLKEKGELESLEAKWFAGRDECPMEDKNGNGDDDSNGIPDEYGPLTLEEMSGLFFILASGILLGLIIAGIEFVVTKKGNAKNENPSVMVPLRENA